MAQEIFKDTKQASGYLAAAGFTQESAKATVSYMLKHGMDLSTENLYGMAQGWEPELEPVGYVQKTDDCDWVF
jgi:hypothetical protein